MALIKVMRSVVITALALLSTWTLIRAKDHIVVTGIIDGQTIEVEFNGKPRLIELRGVKNTTAQGIAYLNRAILNKQIMVEIAGEDHGRMMACILRVSDGVCINKEMLRSGFARYEPAPKNQLAKSMQQAEALAREAQIGLWAKASAETPAAGHKQPSTRGPPKEDIVYITRTGKKYHRSYCRHLHSSRIPVKRKDAEKYYQPCKDCRP